MLRYQGLSTLARAQQRMNAGQIPGNEMVEGIVRSEEHTSELQSLRHLVCRLLLEKKKKKIKK